MLERVRDYIEEHDLLTVDRPVIVGLSGGADSVALITMLCDLGFNCIAAHCNFHLRGEESDRDELFVRNLADYLNISFFMTDFDTIDYAADKGVSIEMAARDLRYQWFDEMRIKLGAQAIAVAHHEQDNVETLLLNLIRGTGIRGLTGIKPKNGYIVRPLLGIGKEDLLDWLEKKNLNYVTDSTNMSDEYARNFLRLRVIPLLYELNPAVHQTIIRTSENLTEAEAIYSYAVDQIKDQIFDEQGAIVIELLLKFPSPRTVLYETLKPYGFNASVTNDIYKSLRGDSGKRFYSETHQLIKDRNHLLIESKESFERTENVWIKDEGNFTLYEPIQLSIKKETLPDNYIISKDKNTATLDYSKLRFPLLLRRWKEGDWFVPFGMKGRKKLSDYFTDRKFNLFEKERIWVICSGEDIIWVVGERIDNRFCINKSSKDAFVIQFSE